MYRRKANTTAMIFRLAFLHALYAVPAWFLISDFTKDEIPGLLSVFFSALILITVILIRLRKLINGRTERAVENAADSRSDSMEIRQGFDFRDYLGLNAEVMFSYLRPWLTILSGLVFLGITVYIAIIGTDMVRLGLGVILSIYFLAFPWVIFLFRVRRVFRAGFDAMSDQVIRIEKKRIILSAGESGERKITALEDIAVTKGYLLLYVAGSNYMQIKRSALGSRDESTVLARASNMVE